MRLSRMTCQEIAQSIGLGSEWPQIRDGASKVEVKASRHKASMKFEVQHHSIKAKVLLKEHGAYKWVCDREDMLKKFYIKKDEYEHMKMVLRTFGEACIKHVREHKKK